MNQKAQKSSDFWVFGLFPLSDLSVRCLTRLLNSMFYLGWLAYFTIALQSIINVRSIGKFSELCYYYGVVGGGNDDRNHNYYRVNETSRSIA